MPSRPDLDRSWTRLSRRFRRNQADNLIMQGLQLPEFQGVKASPQTAELLKASYTQFCISRSTPRLMGVVSKDVSVFLCSSLTLSSRQDGISLTTRST